MTVTEKKNLLKIKQNIYDSCYCEHISDAEFYDIVSTKCLIDLIDIDWEDIEEHEEEIIDWIEELNDKKLEIKKLETLFIYIEYKGYELESLLNSIDYSEDNLDITTLSSMELTYIEEKLLGGLADIEYFSKLQVLEDMVFLKEEAIKSNKYLDTGTFFSSLADETENEIEALKKEIEALKSSNRIHTLKQNLEQLNILQEKDFLSTHELAIIYPNMSLNRQVTYRGRIHDPLPFQQLKRGAKITYSRKAVDIWIANNNK